MFLQINSASSIISTYDDELYHYNYYIQDSTFKEFWEGSCTKWLFNTCVRPGAIISCYESKGEDVAYNLALYHIFMKLNHKWYVMYNELDYCRDEVPKYNIYADKVKEYLNRLNKLKAFW